MFVGFVFERFCMREIIKRSKLILADIKDVKLTVENNLETVTV